MSRQPKKFVNALSILFSRDAQLRDTLRTALLEAGFAAPSTRSDLLAASLYSACLRDEEMPALLLARLYAKELRSLCTTLDLGRPTTAAQATELLLTAFGYEPDDEEEEVLDDDAPRESFRESKQDFLAEVAFDGEAAARIPMAHQKQVLTEAIALTHQPDAVLVSIATGGGKTMVGNDFVRDWIAKGRGGVLWVTKDWDLLRQALTDATRRGIIPLEKARRLGGRAKALRHLEEATGQHPDGITYTTLHTLLHKTKGKRGLQYLPGRPTLVVWDECHWADSAASSDLIRALAGARRITLLGLTATPKPSTLDLYTPTTPWSYRSLADRGILAQLEEVTSIPTGVVWTPTASASSSDFTLDSIENLGRSKPRNSLIVETYCANPGRYGKTLLFACSIDQANALCREFRSRGVSVVAFHAGMSDAENQLALSRFRSGAAQLLVNVSKFTHGVDVPDIETLFLCRPTMSDVLFSQMVGRAVRKADGKETFRIVEFTDNVARFAPNLLSAESYFNGTPDRSATATRRPTAARDRRQTYDPRGTLLWLPASDAIPEPLRGLPFRLGQTFGIEFEMTLAAGDIPHPDSAPWRLRAEGLRRALEAALPGRVAPAVTASYQGAFGDKDVSVWNVEYDSTCGWEVTSPVLSGEQGMVEVWHACRALETAAEALGLVVNFNTGTHIHLGWLGAQQGPKIVRALRLARFVEPVLATLVAPSRVAEALTGGYDITKPNAFCRPVSTVFPESFLASNPDTEAILERAESERGRYLTVNVRPLDTIGTVEVRMHSGTLDAAKILAWVSLWMQLLFVAGEQEPSIPLVADRTVIRPSRLLLPVLATLLPFADTARQQAFLRRLQARHEEVVSRWKQAPSLAPWLT